LVFPSKFSRLKMKSRKRSRNEAFGKLRGATNRRTEFGKFGNRLGSARISSQNKKRIARNSFVRNNGAHKATVTKSLKLVSFQKNRVTQVKKEEKVPIGAGFAKSRKMRLRKAMAEKSRVKRKVKQQLLNKLGNGALESKLTQSELQSEIRKRLKTSQLDKLSAYIRQHVDEKNSDNSSHRSCLRPFKQANTSLNNKSSSEVPWMSNKNSISSLHEEILSFVEFVGLKPVEKRLREIVLEKISWGVEKSTNGEMAVEVFGSHKYNLATFYSDIDMKLVTKSLSSDDNWDSSDERSIRTVHQDLCSAKKACSGLDFADNGGQIDKNFIGGDSSMKIHIDTDVESGPIDGFNQDEPQTRKQAVAFLRKLSKELGRSVHKTWIRALQTRAKSSIPIISLKTWSGLEGDISVGGYGRDSSSAVSLVSSVQGARSLICVLKLLLAQVGLDKTFTGGLGSFRLYVLVTKHMERFNLSWEGEKTDLGVALKDFLKYHSSNKRLYRGMRIEFGDLMVEMEPVFNLHAVVEYFSRLSKKLSTKPQGPVVRKSSIESLNESYCSELARVFFVEKLRRDRNRSLFMAEHSINQSDCGKLSNFDKEVESRLITLQKDTLKMDNPIGLLAMRKLNSTLSKQIESTVAYCIL